jgi:hypothetical protein
MKATDNLGDLRVNGMILKWTGSEGVDWSHMAQGRAQWRAVMNTVMNLRVHRHFVPRAYRSSFLSVLTIDKPRFAVDRRL